MKWQIDEMMPHQKRAAFNQLGWYSQNFAHPSYRAEFSTLS
jgi:hypothetical protein